MSTNVVSSINSLFNGHLLSNHTSSLLKSIEEIVKRKQILAIAQESSVMRAMLSLEEILIKE